MKKGFTLIELLGVLILLAVIALITFPIIDKVLSNAKNEAYERQKDSILEAARLYVTENGNYNLEQEKLNFEILIDKGYLKSGEILDPRDSSKKMPGCVIYNWSESKNQYIFEYDENCIPPTPEKCFTYLDYEGGVGITGYNVKCGGTDVVIPSTIENKPVIYISRGSFMGKGLTSIDLSKLTSLEAASVIAFCNNNILEENFVGIGEYNYDYFSFSSCEI